MAFSIRSSKKMPPHSPRPTADICTTAKHRRSEVRSVLTDSAVIAIGSGGVLGKGYLKGTQAHLEFIPEKHTDFIFAVFSEEWGLAGGLVLLTLYMALIARGLYIAAQGATLFGRLLAGSLTLAFFVYAFVNIGMVSGVLPVVGVPLPFMSYGGTALTTLGIAIGMIMSVGRQRRLMKS